MEKENLRASQKELLATYTTSLYDEQRTHLHLMTTIQYKMISAIHVNTRLMVYDLFLMPMIQMILVIHVMLVDSIAA